MIDMTKQSFIEELKRTSKQVENTANSSTGYIDNINVEIDKIRNEMMRLSKCGLRQFTLLCDKYHKSMQYDLGVYGVQRALYTFESEGFRVEVCFTPGPNNIPLKHYVISWWGD